jgi:ribosomal protein S18 acetylase RimI-like enzyme
VHPLDVELKGYRVATMPDSLRQWAFDLTKKNMFDIYESTWGWNNLEKRRELAHANARFFVANGVVKKTKNKKTRLDEENDISSLNLSPVAFAHVRFEVEADDEPVLYVYELQCASEARGCGIGRFVMRAVQAAGVRVGAARILLTVLKKNVGAFSFYERLGYRPEKDTPSDETCVYVILSKQLDAE